MPSKIVDINANMQVIGCVYKNPSLLDNSDKYQITGEDFTEEFHRILFGSIYNLYQLGAKEISPITIESYLAEKPKKLAVFQLNKGTEYLERVSQYAQYAAFDYYYNRMKKMTLLRMYDSIGLDITWLYDVDNILDAKKRQKQEEWIDNTPIERIAEVIDNKITDIRLKYAGENSSNYYQAADGAARLVESLRENPDVGIPLYGDIINTMVRGARLTKFYLRSCPTGVGKTRMNVADACYFSCDELWDAHSRAWIKKGSAQPTLFIATEQNLQEIQTAMMAFISCVNEEHILLGEYRDGEYERVLHAIDILKRAPLHVKELPDFSLQDIENTIKFSVREWGVRYVVYDYLHSSMKILSEVGSKAKVSNLREDNVLFMVASKLKDLCNQYGIFIITSTQLNGAYMDAEVYNEGLLRGAKSLADRIDVGVHCFNIEEKDKEALMEVCSKLAIPMPDMKMIIYKNRGGRWKDILLWCVADKGTCRINPIFVTDYNYQIINVDNINIEVDFDKK